MLSEFILDVTEATFEQEVLLRSHQVPVVVDFWASWCGPCRTLGPILERLAIERGGDFYLARVDVDQNPGLAIRYGVQGIPAVKGFVNGQVKAQFVGAQPEPVVRRFIERLVPDERDQVVQEGMSLLATHHWAEAERAFRQVYQADDTNAKAALGLLKSLLMQGKGLEAVRVLERFPSGPEWAMAQKLRPLARALAEVEQKDPYPDDPREAEFYQALRLIRRGNLPAGMDGLLDLLRQDKNYRQGEPKAIMLAIFELLGDQDQLTRQYRSELASVLF